uniref:Uncharacterized protein n=1 Tax=viral metagenome TaxID=1070528 RepID=A0A6C0BVE0_9ZZZZ
MLHKFLSEYDDSKEAIYNWDELLNFGVNDLTTKFNYEGKEEITTMMSQFGFIRLKL